MMTKESAGKPGLTKLSDLYEIAKQLRKKKLVLAVAHDEHSLGAVCSVTRKNLIEAVLVGSEKRSGKLRQSLTWICHG